MSTLATAKPLLEKELYRILEHAAYEAFCSMNNKSAEGPMEIRRAMDRQLKESARRFSTKFAEESAGDLSKAIYDFVKSAGIMMKPSGSLISTSITTPAPVIGVCPISDFTIL